MKYPTEWNVCEYNVQSVSQEIFWAKSGKYITSPPKWYWKNVLYHIPSA